MSQARSPLVATASGVLGGNVTVNDDLDVWLLPNFGFANSYGETGNLNGWNPTAGIAYSSEAPNANFMGSIAGATYAQVESAQHVAVSYGRTYTLAGWFKKGVAGGLPDLAGIGNYDSGSVFLRGEDINESGVNNTTWLIQPMADGATEAYVQNPSIFADLRTEYFFFNLFTPLVNWSRTQPVQKGNQANALKDIYQQVDYYANWPKVNSINTGNGRVGLTCAYHGSTLPIGTPVAMRDAAGSFQYQLFGSFDLPTAWTYYTTTFSYMRTGTESASLVGLLWNPSTRMAGYEMWEGGVNDRPKLYYTINGSPDIYNQTPDPGPKKLTLHGNHEGTIKVGQRGTYYLDATATERTITFQAATPTVTAVPASGSLQVTLATATAGAVMFHNLSTLCCRTIRNGRPASSAAFLFSSEIRLATLASILNSPPSEENTARTLPS